MNLNVCENCAYFSKERGECHGNPPTVFLVMTQSKMAPGRPRPASVSFFPAVSGLDTACRFFSVKIENQEKDGQK